MEENKTVVLGSDGRVATIDQEGNQDVLREGAKPKEVMIIGGRRDSVALRTATRAVVEAAGLRARVEEAGTLIDPLEEDPKKAALIAQRRAAIGQRREILNWNQKVENERLAKKAGKPHKARKNDRRKHG